MSIPPLPGGLADTPATRAANALHSISIHTLRAARAADKETGLSPERLSLLSVLVFAGPQTAGVLAEIEGVSRPAISRIVSYLEEEGLTSRAQGSGDRREVRVRATARGAKLMERGRKRRLELIAARLEGLSERELARVSRAMMSLAK